MALDVVKADPVLTGDAGPLPFEGALLPETYLFLRGATRGEIVAKMQKAQQELLDELWAKRAPNLPVKTKEEAVILASIVEKETALPAERPPYRFGVRQPAAAGMKLQSDPTIIYGITKGYPLGRRIRQSEIDRPTPYNTYAIAACRRSRSAIPARIRLRPCSTPRIPRTCFSSRTAPADTSLPPAAQSRPRTSPNGAGSRRNRALPNPHRISGERRDFNFSSSWPPFWRPAKVPRGDAENAEWDSVSATSAPPRALVGFQTEPYPGMTADRARR